MFRKIEQRKSFCETSLSDIACNQKCLVGLQVGRSFFSRALAISPVRTAAQTACPEEFSARARKGCEELKGQAFA